MFQIIGILVYACIQSIMFLGGLLATAIAAVVATAFLPFLFLFQVVYGRNEDKRKKEKWDKREEERAAHAKIVFDRGNARNAELNAMMAARKKASE